MAVGQAEFDFIRTLVRQRTAIVLDEEKAYLAEARLAPVLVREGLSSIAELVSQMRFDLDDGLHRQVVEALTTNETYFFRDHRPFEAFRQVVLPDLLKARQSEKRLHIWC